MGGEAGPLATEKLVSRPLSRRYLANHLGAVMGPVQLSELSQELKPAPAGGGPDWETVRGDQASAARGEGLASRAGPLVLGGIEPVDQKGKPRQEALQDPGVLGGPGPSWVCQA